MRFKTYLRHLVAYLCDLAFDGKRPLFATEEELAAAARLHPNTVYKLRTGRTVDPKLQTIWKICKAVDADISLISKEMAELAAGVEG